MYKLVGDFLQDGFLQSFAPRHILIERRGNKLAVAEPHGEVDWDFPTLVTPNAEGRIDLGGGREFLCDPGEFERVGLGGNGETIQDRVAEAGRLLYGDRWQSDLARDLNVSVRAMQNWFAAPTSSSYREMPAGILADVGALVERRTKALQTWSAT